MCRLLRSTDTLLSWHLRQLYSSLCVQAISLGEVLDLADTCRETLIQHEHEVAGTTAGRYTAGRVLLVQCRHALESPHSHVFQLHHQHSCCDLGQTPALSLDKSSLHAQLSRQSLLMGFWILPSQPTELADPIQTSGDLEKRSISHESY